MTKKEATTIATRINTGTVALKDVTFAQVQTEWTDAQGRAASYCVKTFSSGLRAVVAFGTVAEYTAYANI